MPLRLLLDHVLYRQLALPPGRTCSDTAVPPVPRSASLPSGPCCAPPSGCLLCVLRAPAVTNLFPPPWCRPTFSRLASVIPPPSRSSVTFSFPSALLRPAASLPPPPVNRRLVRPRPGCRPVVYSLYVPARRTQGNPEPPFLSTHRLPKPAWLQEEGACVTSAAHPWSDPS